MNGAKKIKSKTWKVYGSTVAEFIAVWKANQRLIEYYDGATSGVYDIAAFGSVAKVIFEQIINNNILSTTTKKSKNKTKSTAKKHSTTPILTCTTMKSGIETTYDLTNINITIRQKTGLIYCWWDFDKTKVVDHCGNDNSDVSNSMNVENVCNS